MNGDDDWIKGIFARQDAVQEHALGLFCPACGGAGQLQIMNMSQLGAPFDWRCRTCRHAFTDGGENGQ